MASRESANGVAAQWKAAHCYLPTPANSDARSIASNMATACSACLVYQQAYLTSKRGIRQWVNACAHSIIQFAANNRSHLEGLSLWQRVPVHERQGHLVADQAAACIANVHTAKIRHGVLGMAAQVGLYRSEGVYSATGRCSVKSPVKQLLKSVYFLRAQIILKTGLMIL